KATPVTPSACPARDSTSWPVAVSHSRTVPSAPALASRCPSGGYATPVTGPGGPLRDRSSWPDPAVHTFRPPAADGGGPGPAGGGGEGVPGVAGGQRLDGAAVGLEREGRAATGHVPGLDHAPRGARPQPAAVGAEGQGGDRARDPGRGEPLPAGGGVPD